MFVLFRLLVSNRHLRAGMISLVALVVILSASTVCFKYIEAEQNLSFVDSFWLSVVTMTTVGYGDLYPKTTGGRLFAIGVTMVCGIGIMAYLISLLATAVIERETKLMNGELELTCEGHVLIIHYPNEEKVHAVIDELRKFSPSSVPIVLITADIDTCPAQLLRRENFYFVRGNPTWHRTLERANAIKANEAVILARHPNNPSTDGRTTQVALMIEQMHQKVGKDIFTVAEVVSKDSIDPLKMIGVEHVICLETLVPPLLANALQKQKEK